MLQQLPAAFYREHGWRTMDDHHYPRRYVKPAGQFECKADDGSTGELNVVMEFERSGALPTSPEEPIGWVLFWRGKRVQWVAQGRYLTADGAEVRTGHPNAP
jgi:hypothetical protein